MAPTRILRDRVAGQSAMWHVVSAQQLAAPQSSVGRFFGVSPLTPEARISYRGALGELLVGDVLENLGHRWDVLHDVPLGYSSLDHLVIGPAGVFTVHTANCNGVDAVIDDDAMLVAGEARHDIPVARAVAGEVAQILSAAAGRPITVSPLLVVVGPRRLIVRTAPDDVAIISSADLEKRLCTAPQALNGDEVALISDIADLDVTWPVAGETVLDTQKLHRDFSVIRAHVGTALVRRIAWAAAATTVVYISVCSVIAALVSMMMK
ncbi:MAG: nuclease-related domain-containing protein [Rhodoglobus sp.]